MSLTDNYRDIPPPLTGKSGKRSIQPPNPLATPLTENSGDARHQASFHFILHGLGFLEIPLSPPPWTDHYQGEDRDLTIKEGPDTSK